MWLRAPHPSGPGPLPSLSPLRGARGALRAGYAGAVLLIALVAACAHPSQRPEAPPAGGGREAPRQRVETGVASYYARSLEGRRTASGERYRGASMTCAHRTHPFGAVLRVTELESGRSVLVEVNDRGPFESGRIIDLSWAAARALGILERGVARVKVERVQ
jgi:rare lipoprotein A